MAREVVLERIREAEARRREMEEAAAKERERVLQEARREVRRILDEAEASAARAASEHLSAAQKAIQEERAAILARGEAQNSRRRAVAESRVDEASECIYKEFLRRVNA